MNLRVLYFARLREMVGTAQEDIVLPAEVNSIQALTTWLSARGGVWQEAFSGGQRLRAAVNQELAADAAPIKDGDEVAFFPPVTGG